MEKSDQEAARNQLREDALKAWAHYQETGIHLTGNEAEAWLEKLEHGEDAEAPTCHI